MVAAMVAPALLVPALLINIDWTQGILSPWNLAAAGSIVGSAVFVEAARHARSWGWSPFYVLLACLLFFCNTQIAFENASHKSDHRSDHRKTAMVAAKTQWSQRSQWSQGRAEAATVAGEKASATYAAEIEAAIAQDARRWQATGECDPLKITAADSRAFCQGISNLKAKMEAAKRRDELDAKIAAVDAKTEKQEVPTSANPFADNVASFLSMFGVVLTEDAKKAINAQRDITRSLALELVATFGPSAWLLMVHGMIAGHPRAPAPTGKPGVLGRIWRKSENRVSSEPTTPPVAESLDTPAVALDDPFHKFVAEAIEEVPGISAPANGPWTAWLDWCAKSDVKTGSQKAFGTKMKARFAWEPNNNRPRYLNIRVRATKPTLRVVG
jgi:hypothetical protein